MVRHMGAPAVAATSRVQSPLGVRKSMSNSLIFIVGDVRETVVI